MLKAELNSRRIGDFNSDDRRVIAERTKLQSCAELAEVFCTTPQTIAAIARGAKS